jgi:cephalosporin hydroxylase
MIYMVVFDGVMESLTDPPNSLPMWVMDGPVAVIRDFLAEHEEFEVVT